jgi:hypothetical protein
MIDRTLFMRGSIRHMFRIGQLQEHKELRARNEARLAALKEKNKLVEEFHEKPQGVILDTVRSTLQ